MISNTGKTNFFVSHYDKIVTAVGLVAVVLGGVFFALSLGVDADEAAADSLAQINRKKPAEPKVEKLDMKDYATALGQTRTPATLQEVADRQENFLASEKRVKCVCGKIMPGGLETCPACNVSLVTVNKVDEEAKKAEQWAKKYGVALDDSDADNDGFTNAEEYAMGTDPTDAKDHADYVASLKLQLPLKETYVPFYLKAVNKIPAGFRCEFAQGKMPFSATLGEALVITKTSGVGKESKTPTGYKLLSAEKKEKKVKMAGVAGMKTVDASVATIERTSDGKKIELVVTSGKPKPVPVDVQATLVYERGTVQTFEVVPGSELDLNGTKYKVVSVKAADKGAEVVLENSLSGKKQTIKALE